MIIYHGTTDKFTEDVSYNRLTGIMEKNFYAAFNKKPHDSERNSWQNSLPRVKDLIQIAGLKDNIIAVEYSLPYNEKSRIDCLLFGEGEVNDRNIFLIELKQWSEVKALEYEDNYVETFTGRGNRVVPHPGEQVKGYCNYLLGFVEELENQPPLNLYGCAYCHNYSKKDKSGLFADVYKEINKEYPIYCKEDVEELAGRIKKLLKSGNGFEIFNRYMRSAIKPSKKLLDNAGKIVQNNMEFSLIDDQIVAKNKIWGMVKQAKELKEKTVVIVKGGPGTGKTLIAVNILAEAAKKKFKVFYACKSKPFNTGLQKIVGKGAELLFSNLYRFFPSKVKENEVDLLLVDEAHRTEEKISFQYASTADRVMPQVEQLIRAAKTTVFFIDDRQVVRSSETGNSEVIKLAATNQNIQVNEIELTSQFRCMGSNDYLEWLESVLGYGKEKKFLHKNEIFDFKVYDNVKDLYKFIEKKEKEKPNSARIVAGYCWKWSDPNPDGTLVDDVVIGSFKMPWEARDGFSLTKGIPKWFEWAYKTKGVEQVGCIYTVQGFEFDYIGVIIGPDMKYDKTTNSLITDYSATADPTLRKSKTDFDKYIKNIYRVLLTRGMKGCYVYCTDKAVSDYFKTCFSAELVENVKTDLDMGIIIDKLKDAILPQREVEPAMMYKEFLPLYSLKAACGQFGEGVEAETEGWLKVDIGRTLDRNMFVTQVHGKSMEPKMKDGDYCVFRANVFGSRQNKIVIVQHNDIYDLDTGGKYTVKKYTSKKVYKTDGTWGHDEIVLEPLNPKYSPIIIPNEEDAGFMVIAELIKVI